MCFNCILESQNYGIIVIALEVKYVNALGWNN